MVTIVAAVHELPAEIDAALKLDVILMNQNSGKKAVLAYSVPPADAPSRPTHHPPPAMWTPLFQRLWCMRYGASKSSRSGEAM